METKANYVAVGAFVLSCALGMLIALLWLGGAQYREEFSYYKTYFSGAVTGLGNGTAVRYNGIDVGRVSKLNFDPDDPKRVIVTLEVSPALPIHNDSEASIASEGLTGGSYVEIDGGSKDAPLLPSVRGGDMPVIRSKPSTMQQLEQTAPQLVAKLNRIADHLNAVLSPENIRAISETLDHVRNTTAVFDHNAANFNVMFANLAKGSATLNVDLSDLHTVLGGAGQTTQKLDRLVDNLNTQVTGAQIGQLASQTRALEESLTNLSNELEREPTRILFGDRRKGYTPP